MNVEASIAPSSDSRSLLPFFLYLSLILPDLAVAITPLPFILALAVT